MDFLNISPDPESEKGPGSQADIATSDLAPDLLASAALHQAGSASPLASFTSSTPSLATTNVTKQDTTPGTAALSSVSQLPAISEDDGGPDDFIGDSFPSRVTAGDPIDSGEDKPAFSAEVADIINQIRAKKVGSNGTPTPPIWPPSTVAPASTTLIGLEDDSVDYLTSTQAGSNGNRGGRRRANAQVAQDRLYYPGQAYGPDVFIGGGASSAVHPGPRSGRRGGRGGRGGRGRGKGRGGRGSRGGRGGARGAGTGLAVAPKRKRSIDDGEDDDDDGDFEGGATDSDGSSENFTLVATTSSGRKISQAHPAAPTIKIDEELILDGTDSSPVTPATPAGRGGLTPHYMSGRGRGGRGRGGRGRGGPGSRGGRGGRGGHTLVLKTPGAAAVCKNCSRGHSPASNAIVFCDVCNKGWHQYCHDPPVPQAVLTSPDAPWFCADCTILREERDRLGMLKNRTEGAGLSLAEKKRYLSGLSKDELVGLVIHACSVNPDLAIFGKEAYRAAGRLRRGDDDELLPYPKAGNGVRLRPENEDAALLVDDDDLVYSHTFDNVSEVIADAETRVNGVIMHEASVGA